MIDWRPIETAPKDGTWILASGDGLNKPAIVVRWEKAAPFGWEDWYDGEYRIMNKLDRWAAITAP